MANRARPLNLQVFIQDLKRFEKWASFSIDQLQILIDTSPDHKLKSLYKRRLKIAQKRLHHVTELLENLNK